MAPQGQSQRPGEPSNSSSSNSNNNSESEALLLHQGRRRFVVVGGDSNANNDENDFLLSSLSFRRSAATELEMPLLDPGNEERTSDNDDQVPSCSLAFAPSTPCWARYGIPLGAILTHLIFLYGQFAPMWKLNLHQDIDVWANATSSVSKHIFNTVGYDPPQIHFFSQDDHEVMMLTYRTSVEELWAARGMPGVVVPRIAAVLLVIFSGVWPHVKLLLLNRIWLSPSYNQRPTFDMEQTSRQRALYWLSFLGKWSLSDVLVVCVMLGILHMEWLVDPDLIESGVTNNLPLLLGMVHSVYSATDLCNEMLQVNCLKARKIKTITSCTLCRTTIKEAFSHPSWAQTTGENVMAGIQTSGGGIVQMSVVGMTGIYFFCTAVILSISLSIVLDVMDAKARHYYKYPPPLPPALPTTAIENEETGFQDEPEEEENDDDDDGVRLATLNYQQDDDHEEVEDNDEPQEGKQKENGGHDDLEEERDILILREHQEPTQPSQSVQSISSFSRPTYSGSRSSHIHEGDEEDNDEMTFWDGVSVVMSLIVAMVVSGAVFVPTMDRKTTGAVPYLIHRIIGMDMDQPYSLHTLMETTGEAGGWDYLLMGTFGLFLVAGPLIRAGLIILRYIVVGRYCCYCKSKYWKVLINFAGAFCAWEVFCCSAIMVGFLMGPITGTIFPKPTCSLILQAEQKAPADEPRHEDCFQVQYDFLNAFWLLLTLGGFLLAGMAYNATQKQSKGRQSSSLFLHARRRLDGYYDGDDGYSQLVLETNHQHRRRLSSGISGTEEASAAGFSLTPVTVTSASSTTLLAEEDDRDDRRSSLS